MWAQIEQRGHANYFCERGPNSNENFQIVSATEDIKLYLNSQNDHFKE